MSNTKLISFSILIAVLFSACVNDTLDIADENLTQTILEVSPTQSLDYYKLPNEGDYFAYSPKEYLPYTIDQNKIELGKMLFFETALGSFPAVDQPDCYETYSCATCHLPEFAFTPGAPQALADGGVGLGVNRFKNNLYDASQPDAQGARPLSLINVTYVTNTLWSGIFGGDHLNEGTDELWDNSQTNAFAALTHLNDLELPGIETQNIENIAIHRFKFDDAFLNEHGYMELFDEAFEPGFASSNPELAFSYAISAYIRSILAHDAPFQKWLKGESQAMTQQQKLGAALFFGDAGCAKCHNAPNLGGYSFHALGTADMHMMHPAAIQTGEDDPRNLSRGAFTGADLDMHAFKVPQLYNTKDYATYFHGSSKTNLEDVVDYKLEGKSEHPDVSQLSASFQPVYLTADERTALIDFLANGLYDPELSVRHTPLNVLSGNCFPNNDAFSRFDLGCD